MKHLSKRLLALLLVALLSVSLCVPALAANESNNRGAVFSAELDKPTVYVSDQEQTVVVSIKVNQKITLDSFEADVVEEGGIKGTAVSSQDLPGFQIGSGKVAWMSFTPDNYETDHICDITFTIPANTPAGTYTLGLKTLLITADIFQGSDEYWEDTAVATATLTITCPHTAKTEHPAVAATCTEPGSEVYYTCDACGQMLDKDGNAIDAIPVVDALGHDSRHHDRVEPTHEENGNIEYWTCARCGKFFSDQACTKEITEADTILPAQGHNYSKNWSSDAENHWHACDCGSKTDVAAHDFQWVIDREPTEESTGMKHEECTVCQYAKEGVEIPKLDHTHNMIHHDAVPATCTNDGTVEYWHCTKCGKDYSDAAGALELTSLVAPALGHDWDQWIEDTAATCTEKGLRHHTCLRCQTTEEEVLEALGHDMTHHAAKAATCVAEGNIEYWTCARCQKDFADKAGTREVQNVTLPVDPDNHAGNTEVRGQKDATCTEDGYSGDTWCLDCGKKIADGQVIEALGHDMTHHAAKAATCVAEGNIEYWTCARCQKDFADKAGTREVQNVTLPVDPDNHAGNTEVRGQKDATCTEDGYSGDTWCLDCGKKIADGQVIKALGHDMTHHAAKAATCTEDGNTEYWSCARCQKNFTDEVGEKETADVTIPATGHHWDEGKITKEATAAETGEKTFTCTICGVTRTETIPATGEPDQPAKPDQPTTPKTGDAGVVLYAAMAVLATMGGAVVLNKKKHTV